MISLKGKNTDTLFYLLQNKVRWLFLVNRLPFFPDFVTEDTVFKEIEQGRGAPITSYELTNMSSPSSLFTEALDFKILCLSVMLQSKQAYFKTVFFAVTAFLNCTLHY